MCNEIYATTRTATWHIARWRIKAARAVTQSRPPPQPSIPPHLFHAQRRWWANEFLWPPINHANESHPAKIISYSQHMSQWGEEVGVWLMKHASIFASPLLSLIPFFFQTFPLFPIFSLPLAFYLLLPAPQSSLSSSLLLSLLFSIFFSNPLFTSLPGFLVL